MSATLEVTLTKADQSGLQRCLSELHDLNDDQLDRLYRAMMKAVDLADEDIVGAMFSLTLPVLKVSGQREELAEQVDRAITGHYFQWIDDDTGTDETGQRLVTPMCICPWAPDDEDDRNSVYDLVTAFRWLVGHRRVHEQPDPTGIDVYELPLPHPTGDDHTRWKVYTKHGLEQWEAEAALAEARRLGPLPVEP